ncbi:GYF domain-containing protein [Montanilutibacter psychrotolerans]|uniref:DUF4339 domain-containing protein n=1 Tax=Montanilutibacter psychrotolerans TaxID=1327343 RepID=A0A3M8ST67_9GAMM|nr:GYF domain-containing protein [Lysobacter psychrotolerans]RNF84501.1 DUF4339 domain-containing protein [Lysobacter psychrotolerans]
MTDWYYHDPALGRVGPIAAEELRARFRDHLIRSETPVWRPGQADWSPLSQFSGELGLPGMTSDPRQPPPLNPPASHRGTNAPPATAGRGLGGCAIAAIIGVVVVVILVPVIAILAAIAIPAYQDYIHRTKVTQVIVSTATLRDGVHAYERRHDACPRNGDEGFGEPDSYASDTVASVRVGSVEEGGCAMEIALRGIAPAVDGETLFWKLDRDAGEWRCQGGSVPNKFLPAMCKSIISDESTP